MCIGMYVYAYVYVCVNKVLDAKISGKLNLFFS